MIATNSPDFISKIFAKNYLTALRLVSNTVNRSNKNSNVLLVTSALNAKSRIFYNNYGCNTKKMPFCKVYTKNMDLSNFSIGVHSHIARDHVLNLIATWPSSNLFFTRQKMDFCKDSFHKQISCDDLRSALFFFYLF